MEWNNEKDNRLRALILAGKSRSEAAAVLSEEFGETITYQAARHRIEFLKIETGEKRAEDEPEFVTQYGCCRFCGQSFEVNMLSTATEGERNDAATHECGCKDAKELRNRDKVAIETNDKIQQLFGEECSGAGFEPIPEKAIAFLRTITDAITGNIIRSASFHAYGAGIQMYKNKDNGITVVRAETKKSRID